MLKHEVKQHLSPELWRSSRILVEPFYKQFYFVNPFTEARRFVNTVVSQSLFSYHRLYGNGKLEAGGTMTRTACKVSDFLIEDTTDPIEVILLFGRTGKRMFEHYGDEVEGEKLDEMLLSWEEKMYLRANRDVVNVLIPLELYNEVIGHLTLNDRVSNHVQLLSDYLSTKFSLIGAEFQSELEPVTSRYMSLVRDYLLNDVTLADNDIVKVVRVVIDYNILFQMGAHLEKNGAAMERETMRGLKEFISTRLVEMISLDLPIKR